MLSENIQEVEYKQWTMVDRSTLEVVKSSNKDKFLKNLESKLKKYITHEFIAKQQAKAQSEMKQSLGESEFLIICDFAENYSFVAQNASQSFHWNNLQVTLHPFMIYYNENNIEKHTSFVVITECNKHNTIAVHLFQSKLIEFLKKTIC